VGNQNLGLDFLLDIFTYVTGYLKFIDMLTVYLDWIGLHRL